MQIVETAIPDVKVLMPKRFTDPRGFFSETYSKRALDAAGIPMVFVQDNYAHSTQRGVVRGLHFQAPPFAQDKLVSCIRGSVLDVAVDIRRGSPTYGRHVKVVLSPGQWNQILVPVGFAHGYCTLEDDTVVVYKVTGYYSPAHERGLLWNDPELGIEWPITPEQAFLSDKDRQNPRLAELDSCFQA